MTIGQSLLQHPELDGETFYLQGTNGIGALCLHGLTATTAEVRPLANYLNQYGYSTYAPLLPGHGTTPQELNRTSWNDWAEDASRSLKILKKDCKSVVVAGESMGGLLALWLAAKNPEIQGVCCYAPAIRISFIWTSAIISKVVPFLNKKSTDDSMAWKGYYVNPTQAIFQLSLLQKEILKLLPSVTQPTLIFQGGLDQTIEPEGSFQLLKLLGSQKKSVIWLNQSSHCLLLDRDQDFVFARTHDFIRQLW